VTGTRAATDNDAVTIRVCLVTVLVGIAAACGGSGTYTVGDAQQAFEANGYVLVDPAADPTGTGLNVWESEDVTVLAPEGGASFFVFVGDPDAAGDLWTAYDPDGSAAFDEREGNVRVMAGGELEPADEERVRASLDALAG
jgi:hypothetical protein